MPQVISRHSARILCQEKDKKKEEKELIDKYLSEEKNLSVEIKDEKVNQKK